MILKNKLLNKIIIALLLVSSQSTLKAGNDFCGIRNNAFKSGEKINYTIYYSVLGMYVNAGNATFTTQLSSFANKPVYHILGIGNSNTKYDWIFKVRDKYESYIDTATLQPYKFSRDVNEGGYKINEQAFFNQVNNTVITQNQTIKVPNCVQDVLSAIYYARNIDFDKYKPNDKIPFNMFLDKDVYSLYIKYMGKEEVKTKYGKFKAIKFKPLLIKGTIFEGGEKMTVWVSDDDNHIPLRIESPIAVGSVKVDMMGYSGLRCPLSSVIQ